MTTTLFYPEHPVPQRYRGVWRRTLLAAPGVEDDTTTTVLWLQTSTWHADLRIPAGRPDFSGVASLDACSADQKAWLTSQQGFAGLTEVTGHAGSELCTWHRILDYQPPAAVLDAGTMQFEPDKLIETGFHQPYLEHWIKLPESDKGFAVLERSDETGVPAFPRELLLVAGEFVMHVRDRKSTWPEGFKNGAPFRQAADTANHAALLDMEISFGRRTSDGWEVQHSLLPWLEKKVLGIRTIERHEETLRLCIDGATTAWRTLEWTPP